VRRELWEYRSIYLAPLGVAAVFLVGFLISLGYHLSFALNTGHSHDGVNGPYEMAGGIMMFTAILLSTYYCLDALYGERRDRSIVFWKSLPVSDLTTVLAKVSIPLVFVPVIASLVSAVLQLIMLLLSSALLASRGLSVAQLWHQVPWLQMSLLLLYHILTAHALWPAPVFAWMLLVSAWARRAPFLWASLPVLAIAGVEEIAFRTSHVISFVGERLIGYAPVNQLAPTAAQSATGQGADLFPTNPMTHIHPGMFLADPSLWGGLIVAAVFVVLTVQLRRRQGPI
jgi:ABC-2 type transport system permease protein